MDWLPYGNSGLSPDHARPVVFLPGWGFDGRLLSLVDSAHPWWGPAAAPHPAKLAAELDALLQARQWGKIVLVGWSLGARLALEYTVRRPEVIGALVLLSLRANWPQEELAAIRAGLAADPVAFMSDFYRKCFLGYREAWQQFVALQLEDRLRKIDLAMLEAGLARLAQPLAPLIERVGKAALPPVQPWLVHGKKDIIAPFGERCWMDGGRQLELANGGHALFLAPEVRTLSFLPQGFF